MPKATKCRGILGFVNRGGEGELEGEKVDRRTGEKAERLKANFSNHLKQPLARASNFKQLQTTFSSRQQFQTTSNTKG